MRMVCEKNQCDALLRDVHVYTLENAHGMQARVTNYGAIVLSLLVPDRHGRREDVILGYDDVAEYIRTGTVHGATIGRYANRIGGASFDLDGKRVELSANDHGNHLHGGLMGFHRRLWTSEVLSDAEGEHLELTYLSRDGEEGYPGNLKVRVRYTLREDNALQMDYEAETDKDTIVNLTNHAFFNLSAMRKENILDHELRIDADAITAVDRELISTGELLPVEKTPFDFRRAKKVGQDILSDCEQMEGLGGYDHNFVLNHRDGAGAEVIELSDSFSGRRMSISTTKPGVQLYTGNGSDGTEVGKKGCRYQRWAGLCLETQFFPDSVHHPGFPSPVLRKGEIYRHRTVWRFSTF